MDLESLLRWNGLASKDGKFVFAGGLSKGPGVATLYQNNGAFLSNVRVMSVVGDGWGALD